MFEFITNAVHAATNFVTGGHEPAAPAPAAHAPTPAPAHDPAAAQPVHSQPAPTAAPHGPQAPGQAPGVAPGATGPQRAGAVDPNNPNAGPPQPQQPPPPDPAQMRAAANQLFHAMDGWGTDEDAIHNALRGRSPAEVSAIRAAYSDHFPGHNLDTDLEGELSGNDLDEARAQMSANPVTAAVAGLRNASEGWGTNEAAIHATLNNITDPQQRAQVAAEYQRQTGTQLTTMLTDEMSGGDLAIAQHEATGDRVGAQAARLNEAMNGGFLGLGLGTDEDAVNTALEGAHTPAERQALATAYQQQTGRTLDTDLHNELSGAELDVAANLRTGNLAAANAARMQVAADGWGTDEDAIFRTLSSARTPEERQQMITAYNERYGAATGGQDFNQMISSEMGDMDSERARQLAANGHMDPAFALRYAMDGMGTDEDMIRETLRGQSREQIAAIREQYRAQYGRDLDAELSDENSGRDGFEISQMMLGEPRTPQEQIARLNAAYDFERGSGSGAIGNFVMDNLAGSDAGRVLDTQHARIAEIEARLNAGQATQEDLARLNVVGEYQRDDVQNYQAVQDSATNALATGATIAVGAIVTVATAGTAAPAVVAAIAALAGGAAGMATKYAMLGSSYSNEQMGIDAVQTIASAVTAGTLKMDAVAGIFSRLVAVNPAGAQTMMEAVRLGAAYGAAGGLSNGIVAGALDERTWRGPGNGLANFLTTVGTSTATGTVSGAVSGATGHAYNERVGVRPDQVNLGGVQATSVYGGMLSGATGSFAQTTTELGIEAARNGGEIGSFESVLARYGQSMAGGVIGGGSDGYAMGVWQQQQMAAAQAAQRNPAAPAADAPTDAGHAPPVTAAADAPAPAVVDAEAQRASGKPATPENTVALVEAAQANPAAPAAIADAPAAVPREAAPAVEAPTPAPAHRPEDIQAIHDLRATARTPDDFIALNSLESEFGMPATAMPDHHADHGARTALTDLSRTAHSPQDVALIQQMRLELDFNNPAAQQHAMREIIEMARLPGGEIDPQYHDTLISMLGDLHHESRQTDLSGNVVGHNNGGVIDNVQGAGLRDLRAQLGTDSMTMAQSLATQGHDPQQVQLLFEQLRQTAASPGTQIDQHGNPLAPSSSLTPQQQELWMNAMGARFDDLTVGQSTMAKMIPAGAAVANATGDVATGQRAPNAVGGFVGLAGNGEGLNAAQRAQMGGFDYDGSPFYNRGTHEWNGDVMNPTSGGIDMVRYGLTQQVHDGLQVPLGTDPHTILQTEAARLAAQTPNAAGRTQYVPELLQPGLNPATGTNLDANGLPFLPHVKPSERNPATGPTDYQPFTAWGFSATREAYEPQNGGMLPVILNQELVQPYGPIPQGAEQVHVDNGPNGGNMQQLNQYGPPTTANGPGTPMVTTTDPAQLQRLNDYLISIGLPPRF